MSPKLRFEQDGFFLAKAVFSPEQVRELEGEFDRIVSQIAGSGEEIDARWSGAVMERIGAGTQVLHTHNVQQYSSVWLRALLDEKFLDVAEALLGPDIILHHSKLFQKPAEKGSPFPMHQDWEYFPTEKDTMLAGVIHVSEATDEMGCLRLYPGSHLRGRLQNAQGQSDSGALARYPLENAVPVAAEPGDVLFFHYLTVHGSMPNRSEKVRKTVLVQLHSGRDAVVEGNLHPNERLALRGWNYGMKRSAANLG